MYVFMIAYTPQTTTSPSSIIISFSDVFIALYKLNNGIRIFLLIYRGITGISNVLYEVIRYDDVAIYQYMY